MVDAGTATPEDVVVDAGSASQDHAHTQAPPEDVVVDAGRASPASQPVATISNQNSFYK